MSVKILFLNDNEPSTILDSKKFNDNLEFDKHFPDPDYNPWKYIPRDAKLDGR